MARTPKISYSETIHFEDVEAAYPDTVYHEGAGGYDSYYGYSTAGGLNEREVKERLHEFVGTVTLAHARLTDEEWEANPATSILTWVTPQGWYAILTVD